MEIDDRLFNETIKRCKKGIKQTKKYNSHKGTMFEKTDLHLLGALKVLMALKNNDQILPEYKTQTEVGIITFNFLEYEPKKR